MLYADDKNYYSENVSDVLIGKDRKNIVILGGKFHYIFPNTENIIKILDNPIRRNIEAKFHEFKVDENNAIYGNIRLELIAANPNEEEVAKSLGFTKYTNGVFQDIALNGKRYNANNNQEILETIKLHKANIVMVSEPQSAASVALKAAATPVTVATDGVLLLFGIPILLLTCSGKSHCK